MSEAARAALRHVSVPACCQAAPRYLVCTPAGMPIMWALANPKTDEREVLQAIVDVETKQCLYARSSGA